MGGGRGVEGEGVWGEQVRARPPGKGFEIGLPPTQERGELRGQERVHRRGGQEFSRLHRHASAHRGAIKGDSRRTVEVLACAQLADARDNARGLALPGCARVVPGATEIASKQLGSPRKIGAGTI